MAYMYPYGDSQQLNLSWFLAKFKELYEYVMQLDPGESDMTAILSRFTEQYSTSKNYIPGDYCIFNGYIYKANRSTSGNFDSGAWDPALPVNDVQGLRILLGGLSEDLTALEQNAVTNTQYTPGAATADGLLRQTKNGTAETVMTVDKEPTRNSQNPVKSGSVYGELSEIKDSLNDITPQILSTSPNDTTCAPSTSTVIATLTLTPGTWLLNASHEWAQNVDSSYIDSLLDITNNSQYTIRNLSMKNGGGATITLILTLTRTATINYLTIQYSDSERTTRRVNFSAIKFL